MRRVVDNIALGDGGRNVFGDDGGGDYLPFLGLA